MKVYLNNFGVRWIPKRRTTERIVKALIKLG
jgi:hypothetical protein